MRLEVDTKDVERRFQLALNEIAIEMSQAFAEAAPVDTGYLKRSFVTPGPIVHSNGLIEFRAADYLDHILFGTPPHIITPKNAQFLHWKNSPEGFSKCMNYMMTEKGYTEKAAAKFCRAPFTKRVEHPGTEANPFVQEVIERQFKPIMEKALRRQFR